MRAAPTTSKHVVLRRSCVGCSRALPELQDRSPFAVRFGQHRMFGSQRVRHKWRSSYAHPGSFSRSRDKGYPEPPQTGNTVKDDLTPTTLAHAANATVGMYVLGEQWSGYCRFTTSPNGPSWL